MKDMLPLFYIYHHVKLRCNIQDENRNNITWIFYSLFVLGLVKLNLVCCFTIEGIRRLKLEVCLLRLFTLFFTKFKLITVIIARVHSWLNERSLLLSSLLYIISLYEHLNFHFMPIKNGSVILLTVNMKYSNNKNEILRY